MVQGTFLCLLYSLTKREIRWNISLTLSQLGTKSSHIYSCGWISSSAITQHETKLQRACLQCRAIALAQSRNQDKYRAGRASRGARGGRGTWPGSDIGWTAPRWCFEKEKRKERKIKECCSAMFYSLFLPAAPAFSKWNVRPEVCVLYSSTQIRLVPDLGNINNSLERCACEWECNSLLLRRLGNTRSRKLGQTGKIRVIGCKRNEI